VCLWCLGAFTSFLVGRLLFFFWFVLVVLSMLWVFGVFYLSGFSFSFFSSVLVGVVFFFWWVFSFLVLL